MGLFSRRRPAVCVVVAEAVFDGDLQLNPTDVEAVELDDDHDVILQVKYTVVDTPDDEHWRIHFRAGLGPEGAATGPAVFDLADRHNRIDSGSGTLDQRLTMPAGEHRVSFQVEAFYNAEDRDAPGTDEEEQTARLEGSIRISA